MGRDLGNDSAAFEHNFTYGILSIGGTSNYVRLVDQADNATGTGAEALYVGTLIVPAGKTLDLNGLHVYARQTQIAGTIVGGLVSTAAERVYAFSTLAGQVGQPGSNDGAGEAAHFNGAAGVAVDGAGNIYVSDTLNHTIRKITPAGLVSTLAGQAGVLGSTDATGAAARFNGPLGLAADATGNVYVADQKNHTIRKITAGGVVTTFAGLAGALGSTDGTGGAARFSSPAGLALDGAGTLFVVDYANNTIRKITSAGVVSTLAGQPGQSGSLDGTGNAARFNRPIAGAVDVAGNLYVADYLNHSIRKVTPAGVVTTIAGQAGQSGSTDGTGAAARFLFPQGVAVDGTGRVYVADTLNHTVRKITPTGEVTTMAGLAGQPGSADGSGTETRFNSPKGLAADSLGNIYIADTNNHTIRLGAPLLGPSITTQPLAQIVTAGTNVTFSVGVTGSPPPTYQWRKGTTAIPGATGVTYSIASAQATDAGSYTVVVTNSGGTVTSSVATLTVNTPPVFTTTPASQTVAYGGNVTLTVAASGAGPLTYQWKRNGLPVAGATSASLAIVGAAARDNGYYQVTVTDAAALTTNAVVFVTVAFNPAQVIGLGSNSGGQTTIPSGLTNVVAISAGGAHSLALKSDGTVVGWGSNNAGQTTVPAGLTGVVAIVAGDTHSLALKSDGTVVGWGANSDGQRTIPSGLSGVVALGAGYNHSLALKSDGTVVAWGKSNFAQTTLPTGLSGVVAIAGGGDHSMALKADGTVVAWGDNFADETTVPTGLAGVVAIAGGGSHNMALKSDGTVAAWGNNNFGQRTVPAGLTGVVAIAAGDTHTLALKSDGTVVAWGNNGAGQTAIPGSLGGVVALGGGNAFDLLLRNAAGGTVPVIIAHPQSQTVAPGATALFSVVATGTPAPGYQWRKSGVNVTGATNASYGITSVQASDAANYDVIVTNSAGNVTSASVALTVGPDVAYEIKWVKAAGGTGSDTPTSTAVDAQGNVIIAGVFSGTSAFGATNLVSAGGDDMFVAKYDATGTLLWARQGGGTGSDVAGGVRTDASGNIFVTGRFTGAATFGSQVLTSAGGSDIFVIKYDPAGSILWIKQAGGTQDDNVSSFGAVAVDTTGGVYITGAFRGTAVFGTASLVSSGADDIFVAKYDTAGALVWAKRYGGTGADFGAAIAVDSVGNSYVTGGFKSTATFGSSTFTAAGNDYDIITLKQDAAGNLLWARNASGAADWAKYGSGIGVDAAGNVYITGGFRYGIATFGAVTLTGLGKEDIFIAKYDASGTLQWAKQAGGANGDWGYGIAVDENGNLYITGSIEGNGAFGSVSLNGTGLDAYLAKYDTNGNAIWATRFGGPNGFSYGGIALDQAGTIYVSGPFSAPGTFGGTQLAGFGSNDIFVAKLAAPSATGSVAPTITTQPLSQTVTAGANVAFSVAAAGTPTLRYQWKKNGGDVAGATTLTLNLTNVQPGDAGNYHAVVTNDTGTVSSNAAVLAVNVAPGITTQPVAQTVNVGQTATFTVAATGTPAPTYQWRKGGTNIGGATNTSYTIASVQLADVGSYDVVVANAAGNLPSDAVTLTVNSAPIIIGITAPRQVTTPGQSLTLSVTTTGAGSFQWKRNGLPIAGATAGSYAIVSASSRDHGYYQVIVTNATGSTTSAVVFVNVATNPAQVIGFGGNSEGQTAIPPGLTAVVAVSAGHKHSAALKSDGTLAAWGENIFGQATVPAGLSGVVAISGGNGHTLALKSDTTVVAWGDNGQGQSTVPTGLTGVVAVSAGIYHSLALKSDGTVVAWGYNQTGQTTVPTGLNAVVAVAAGGYHSLGLKSDGTVVAWGENVYGQITVPAGLSGVASVAAGSHHSLALKTDGTVVAWGDNGAAQSTVPGGLGAVVAIAGGRDHSLALKNDGTLVAWGDNGLGQSAVPVGLTGVAGMAGGGFHTLLLRAAASDIAPVITTQPQSQTVTAGVNVALTVVATGTPAPTYQWLKTGVNIVGATGATLTLNNVQPAAAGNYSVIVANGAGTVTSSMATLTVNLAPVITTQPVAQAVNVGQPAGFTVVAAASPVPTYQWRKGSANISGATNASYTIASTQVADAGSYDVVVTNSQGAVTSNPATLTVNVAPTFTNQPAGTTIVTGATATLTTVAAGTGPLTYLWYRGNSGDTSQLINGATGASYTTPALTATTSYWVRVSGPGGAVNSNTAIVTVATYAPTVALAVDGAAQYLTTGGTVSLRARVTYTGQTPAAIGVTVNVPAGWSLASTGGPNVPQVAPVAGTTNVLEWSYSSLPANEAVFTFVVNSPAGQSGSKSLTGFAIYRPGDVNVTLPTVTLAGVTAIALTTQPQNLQVEVGKSATLSVVATGDPAPTYQWRRDGATVPGATASSLYFAAVTIADGGNYDVVVSNGLLTPVTSNRVLLGVIPIGTLATHLVVGGGYTGLSKVTISNTITYPGVATGLGWQVVLPVGWSYEVDGGTAGETKPTVGTTGELAWAWTTIPLSPVTFTYTLNKPADATGDILNVAYAIVRLQELSWKLDILAKPDPLVLKPVVHHTADTTKDFRINLSELTRVIELYNTRLGTIRTGRYKVQAGTEDGFTLDATATSNQVLSAYHAADSDRNGALNLSELTRVIELYNTRSGTVRTGQYHAVPPPASTEDSYAPGP